MRAMIALSWNYRGLGNPRLVGALHDYMRRWDPMVAFLSKTKRKIACMKKVKGKIDFVNGLYFQQKGKEGGLAMFWRKEVNLEIKSYSRHHINAVITEE